MGGRAALHRTFSTLNQWLGIAGYDGLRVVGDPVVCSTCGVGHSRYSRRVQIRFRAVGLRDHAAERAVLSNQRVNGKPCESETMLPIYQPFSTFDRMPPTSCSGGDTARSSAWNEARRYTTKPLSNFKLEGLNPTAVPIAPPPQSVLYIWPGSCRLIWNKYTRLGSPIHGTPLDRKNLKPAVPGIRRRSDEQRAREVGIHSARIVGAPGVNAWLAAP